MTKTVRIENADTSTWKVKIVAEYLQEDGTWKESIEPPQVLHYPADLATLTVWKGKRLVVSENE